MPQAQMMARSTCLDGPCVMGYSIVARLGEPHVEYRYTEWVDFNTQCLPRFNLIMAPDA